MNSGCLRRIRRRRRWNSRIRSAAVMHNIPLVTTITGARAAVQAIKALREGEWGVRSIQEYHKNA